MIIKRQSPLTGLWNEQEIPVTQAQLDSYYQGGLLLQRAFGNLNAQEREFIKSGMTQADWDLMGSEEA